MYILQLVVVAALNALVAHASPVSVASRAVSSSLLSTLELFAQFSAASYCANNNNSTGNKLTCSTGNCPLVQAANTVTVLEFQNSGTTDVTGYVAVDSTHKLIVTAFRGTNSLLNIIADADFALVSTDTCTGCSADQGFYSSWVDARSGVLAAVKSAKAANPTYSIAVTGHSLGGAIADLAAAELRNAGYSVTLYTYGAPRVGNPAISDYITNQSGGNYRVTHKNDPVPKLPPVILGFVHISPEYYISTGDGVAVTASDINVYTGEYNASGNSGDTTFDINAHGWYFGNISSCGNFELF